MKKLSLLIISCLLLFACKKSASINPPVTPPADQAGFAPASAINQRLGRGVNLGNTYEAYWTNVSADPADFERMAASGFKHVRLPIRWEMPSRTSYQSPYTIQPAFLSTIKSAVDAALKNKLHVIINMHHHDSLFANPDGMKPMFIAQWKQMADYFKNYSDSLVFEVLNEPNSNLDAIKWNSFFSEALAQIRQTNPKRTVLMGVAEWGGVSAIKKLVIPNDDHLILTIHYYNPFQFTHQGADWVDGSNAWLGTKWYDTEFDRQAVADDFKEAIRLQQEKHIPVHVGEFGAYSMADMDSRIRWTRFLSRWFEQQNFSWAYWEFNSGFGIYDPVSGQYKTGLVNALTKDSMATPTATTLVDLYSSNFNNPQQDGWNLYNNDASAASTSAISDNKITVTITKPGTQNWHIQLIRPGVAIEDGKTYRVVFNAYSSGSHAVSAGIMQNVSPWTLYGNRDITLTAQDAIYSYNFVSNATDANAAIVFSMGNDGLQPVTIYNIKVQEVKM